MITRTMVTGFGPFLNVRANPSALLAGMLDRPHTVLEVSYGAVEQFLARLNPDSFDRLLLLGVAQGRSQVCPELFGRNLHGATEDATGTSRTGPILEDKPLLLPSTLFTASALASVLVARPCIRISMDAGRYLCNFALFRALSAFPDKKVGFVHVAPFEALSCEEQTSALRELLAFVEAD